MTRKSRRPVKAFTAFKTRLSARPLSREKFCPDSCEPHIGAALAQPEPTTFDGEIKASFLFGRRAPQIVLGKDR